MQHDLILSRTSERRASARLVKGIILATMSCAYTAQAAAPPAPVFHAPPPVRIAPPPVSRAAPTVRIAPPSIVTPTLRPPVDGAVKPPVSKYRTTTVVQTVPSTQMTKCTTATPLGSKCLRGTVACTKAEGAFLNCPVP